jgi:sugar phosphate isomerase/epimerase
MLNDFGITNIEIAPSRTNPNFNFYQPYSYQGDILNLNTFKLQSKSSQAILYGKNDLSIFNQKSWDDFFTHLNHVFDFAMKFDVNKIVFGSPKSRVFNSKLSFHENIIIAQLFFTKLSTLAKEYNIDILLEPNPKIYNCDFLNTHEEVLNFISLINLSNIKLHIDTGAAIIEGKTGEQFLLNHNLLKSHIHLSCPNLNYNFEDYHSFFFQFLNKIKKDKYDGICIIEIITKNNTLEIIKNTIKYFQQIINKIDNV